MSGRAYKGLFITLEGGEGVGKSTQALLLKDFFQAMGQKVLTTREPGGSPAAEAIRQAILEGRAKKLGPLGEAALLTAARCDHVDQVIRPALEKGDIVICDRFIDSTRVYQGAVDGLDDETLDLLEKAGTQGLKPDITFVLDLPAGVGLERAQKRAEEAGTKADRFESLEPSVHTKIVRTFRAIARKNPKRCVLINAKGRPELVFSKMRRALEERNLLKAQRGAS
jgi:dTMP kinase